MMSNKGLLVDKVDNAGDIVSTVNRAYASLLQLAAYELGEVTLVNGLTCDTHISYRSSRGYTEIIADKDKKMTTMTIAPWSRTRDDRWTLWTSDSVSNRTTVRSTLLTEDEAKQLLTDMPSSMPIKQAVCVLSRSISPDASKTFEDFYSEDKAIISVSEEDILRVIQLDKSRAGRLLRILLSAVDNYNSRHRIPEAALRYYNLFEHRVFDRNNRERWGEEIKPMSPIRAEKVVQSFWLVTMVALREREALLRLLLPDSTTASEEPFIEDTTDTQRLCEAAGKVIGKMCLVGMPTPIVLATARSIYESNI